MPKPQTATNRFFFDKSDPLYATFIEELRIAYKVKHYSVLQIGRCLGQNKVRGLYNLMRNEGILYPLIRGRLRKFTIPVQLPRILKACDIGFAQWCNTHDFDYDEAAVALNYPEDPDSSISRRVYYALRQDFPQAIRKIISEPTEHSTSHKPKNRYLRTDYSVVVNFDTTTHKYVAYSPDIPECRVNAETRDAAFRKLKNRYILLSSIAKLQNLQPKPDQEAPMPGFYPTEDSDPMW